MESPKERMKKTHGKEKNTIRFENANNIVTRNVIMTTENMEMQVSDGKVGLRLRFECKFWNENEIFMTRHHRIFRLCFVCTWNV